MSTIETYPVPAALDGSELFAAWKDGAQVAIPPALFSPQTAGQPGLSAFQQWKQAGNTGSFTDFMASLRGAGATVGVGTVSVGAPGSQPAVTNGGTAVDAVLNFTIPSGAQGNPGRPASIRAGDFGAIGVSDTSVLTYDDSSHLQAMFNAAAANGTCVPGKPGGGVVELDPNRSYYINTYLYVPIGVTVVSQFYRDELLNQQNGNNLAKSTTNYGAQPGTIIFGPNAQIVLNDSSGLRRVTLVSAVAAVFISTAGVNMTAAQVNSLLAAYANYPLAVSTISGCAGPFLDECTILGFNLAAKFVYNERWRVSWCKFDCLNGVYSSQTYDDIRYFANHHYPLVWGHRFAAGTAGVNTVLAAYGTAVKFDTGADTSRSIDAGHVFANMIYGYLVGIDLVATNGLHCYDNWIDGDVSQTNTQQTIGIRTSGNCRRTKILGNHVDSQGRCYDLQGTGVITLDNNTSAGATVSHMRVGPQTLVNGGTHLFQGPSPQYIELDPGIGYFRWNSTWFSAAAGVAIGLAGGAAAAAATRANVSLGKVTIDSPGSGWSFDIRQWRSNVQASNTSAQTLTQGSYTRVAMAATVDGFGEWSGTSFTAVSPGAYSIAATVGLQVSGIASGNAISNEVRVNGIEQSLGRWQALPAGNGLYGGNVSWLGWLNAGDVVDIWSYSDSPATVPTGKAAVAIMRMGDC